MIDKLHAYLEERLCREGFIDDAPTADLIIKLIEEGILMPTREAQHDLLTDQRPEERVLSMIFPKPENTPWPSKPMPEGDEKWIGEFDHLDWASYLGDCIRARTTTPLQRMSVAFAVLPHWLADDADPALRSALYDASTALMDYLVALEEGKRPPEYVTVRLPVATAKAFVVESRLATTYPVAQAVAEALNERQGI